MDVLPDDVSVLIDSGGCAVFVALVKLFVYKKLIIVHLVAERIR
jgi:hypothetical protein